MSLLEQVMWERDIALDQLEEYGIPFGGIATDVVKVVRCEDCKHGTYMWGSKTYMCSHPDYSEQDCHSGDHYCGYGDSRLPRVKP